VKRRAPHPTTRSERVRAFLFAPQPIARLELVRILVPLALLGFFSSRLAHIDDWLGPVGFHVPDLRGGDWRQPLYLAPLPIWAARLVGGALVASGLAVAAGFRTRMASAIFAGLLVYVVLADRLQTFTVSKLGPSLVLALFLSPSGARFGVDAWLRRRRDPNSPSPELVSGGAVRFFQLFLVVMYSGSGIAKLEGDWLTKPVLWTHVHDNYQTLVSYALQRILPAAMWWVLQFLTLAFEVGAPVWFALDLTRTPALIAGLAMHLMIGLMFGPVVWFALLMGSLLIACYAPLPKK
jgi:hypothetical protein